MSQTAYVLVLYITFFVAWIVLFHDYLGLVQDLQGTRTREKHLRLRWSIVTLFLILNITFALTIVRLLSPSGQ